MPSEKKWRRLYVREEGSFAQLPLFTRALAAELIKFADDEGVLHLGGKSLPEAIAFQCGANRSDRRLLPRACAELVTDGYLVLDADRARIRNLAALQGQHSNHSSAAKPPHSDHTSATHEQHTDHVTQPKLPKSHGGTIPALNRTEEIRREERRDRGNARAMPGSDFDLWRVTFARHYARRYGAPPVEGRGYGEAMRALIAWWQSGGLDAAAVDTVCAGFLASEDPEIVKAQHHPAWLVPRAVGFLGRGGGRPVDAYTQAKQALAEAEQSGAAEDVLKPLRKRVEDIREGVARV